MHGNTLLFLVSKSIKLVLIISFLDNTFYLICISVTINCLISGFADSSDPLAYTQCVTKLCHFYREILVVVWDENKLLQFLSRNKYWWCFNLKLFSFGYEHMFRGLLILLKSPKNLGRLLIFYDHLSFEKGACSKTNKQALLALEALVAPVRQVCCSFLARGL